MNKFKRMWMMLLLSFAMIMSYLPMTMITAYAAAGDTPPHAKRITDNQDGTYTISLDITGESEKKPNNVNVIVIMDTSGSMTTQRMNAAKNAVNSLATALYAYNTQSEPDTVEMALVRFATSSSVARTPTNNETQFHNAVNGLPNEGNGGTNWEAALQTANNDIDFGDNDQTFVVFVSDGNPTFRTTQNGWNDWSYQYQQWGTGQETAQNIQRCYTTAVDDAQALATKVTPANFFTIGAFGNVDRMEQLTDDAGSDSSTNYYSAQNTAALNQAISDILAKIERAGFADAEIDDGTTSTVTQSSGEVSHLLVVDESSYKYYRTGGDYGTMDPWTDAPEAKLQNGTVVWDLSDEGVLENGVRYTVTFDCYPSQETYDIIAQLKNGDITYDSLDSEIKKYIVDNGGGSYSLRTNTNASIAWDDTRDDEGRQTSGYTNPDPVATDAETLTATKEWEGGNPDVDELEITVLMDDDPFHTDTIGSSNDWSTTSFISIGIIKGGKVLPGAEGHDFKFAELGSEQYHWELESPVVHPMLIDGTRTMLIMVDEKHPAPSGAKTYEINGHTYYVDEEAAGLTAINHRRSNLNLTKVVTGEDAPADAKFPFELTVNNSKAPKQAPTDEEDPKHESDYWIWLSVRDENGNGVTGLSMGSGVVEDSGGYYYAPNGTTFSLEIGAGWSLRFLNLPTDTTYTFVEGTLPEGFAFNKAELTQGEDSTFSGDQTTTGTIENTKTSYLVTYTNDYALTDLEITKVWDDNDDQDGMRLTADELKAKLTLSPEVAGKEPTVTDKGDGTYTITYKGLPRFNNGEEVTYTVTEDEIEGYETEGSPAEDHGTITNTHEPEAIDIDVEKVWVGPAGDAVTVTLYADGSATDKTLELNEDNEWKGSFTDLPKYEAGEEIEYSVVEDGVSGVDADKYDTTITGDAENGFTITNTNTETVDVEVTKVWDDDSNRDGVRPDDLELTLNGLPDGVEAPDPEITKDGNNWVYKWTDLPKYTDDGTEIEYTVSEETVPEGYEVDGSPAEDGGEITNTHEIDTTSIDVEKKWEDFGESRPSSITVVLLANGEEADKTVLNEDNEWKHTFSNLPVKADGEDITYTVDEVEVEYYDTEITGDAETGFTITNTYEYDPATVDLKANKNISGYPSDGGNVEFTFTLTPTGDTPGEAQTVNVTLSGSKTSAEVVFDTLTFDEPGTYTYTVAETAGSASGWTYATNTYDITITVTDNGEGKLVAEVEGADAMSFLNTYEAAPVEAAFSGTKTLEGRDLEDGEFSFELKDEDGNVLQTVTNADGKFAFDAIEYTEAGTYKYTISEKNTGLGGVTYDTKVYEVTVEVTDDGTGELKAKITGIKSDGSGADFTNTYEAAPVDVTFSGTKTISGYPKSGGNVTFTITLTPGEGAPGGAQSKTATVSGSKKKDEFIFDSITFEEEGTFTYTISETAGSAAGWTYDTKTYEVTVKVTDDGNGNLVADITGLNNDGSGANFTNSYKAGPATVPIVGEKVMKNYGKPLQGGEFSFTITGTGEAEEESVKDKVDEDKTEPEDTEKEEVTEEPKQDTEVKEEPAEEAEDNAEEAAQEAEEAKQEAEEKAEAAEEAKQEAEEKAEIAEKAQAAAAEAAEQGDPDADEAQKAADEAQEEADEAQEAADEAQEEADEAQEAADEAQEEADEAQEEADEAETNAPADENTDAKAEEPKEAETAPADDKSDAKKTVEAPLPENTTVQNDADGVVDFGSIEFTEAGVYTYKITESGSMPGVTNDTGTKIVTVTVTDDGSGKLTATVDPSGAVQFTFTNTYKTPPTDSSVTDTIPVNKELTGHDLEEGKFTFELKDEDGKVVATATNNADGTVTFPPITFTKEGTYTFTVYEKAGSSDVITYDGAIYEVKAEVTNDYDGGDLKIEWTFSGGDEITFNNSYHDDVWIDPPVEKVVVGSPDETETYTFQLEADDESYPMPADADGESSMTVDIEGAGSIEFGKIYFTEPGTYTYTVTEVAGDNDDCEYDDSVYTVKAVVKEDPDTYELSVTTTYTKDGESYSKASFRFVNTYPEEEPDEPEPTPGANTGDPNNPFAVLMVFVLAGLGLGGLYVYKRRHEEE